MNEVWLLHPRVLQRQYVNIGLTLHGGDKFKRWGQIYVTASLVGDECCLESCMLNGKDALVHIDIGQLQSSIPCIYSFVGLQQRLVRCWPYDDLLQHQFDTRTYIADKLLKQSDSLHMSSIYCTVRKNSIVIKFVFVQLQSNKYCWITAVLCAYSNVNKGPDSSNLCPIAVSRF